MTFVYCIFKKSYLWILLCNNSIFVSNDHKYLIICSYNSWIAWKYINLILLKWKAVNTINKIIVMSTIIVTSEVTNIDYIVHIWNNLNKIAVYVWLDSLTKISIRLKYFLTLILMNVKFIFIIHFII